MKKSSFFPEMVTQLPEADIPFEGIEGWILDGEQGQILFQEFQPTLKQEAHSHGNQWEVILDGEITQYIDGVPHHCKPGDCIFIPAGAMHYVTPPYTTVRLIEYFDFKRVKPKSA